MLRSCLAVGGTNYDELSLKPKDSLNSYMFNAHIGGDPAKDIFFTVNC